MDEAGLYHTRARLDFVKSLRSAALSLIPVLSILKVGRLTCLFAILVLSTLKKTGEIWLW